MGFEMLNVRREELHKGRFKREVPDRTTQSDGVQHGAELSGTSRSVVQASSAVGYKVEFGQACASFWTDIPEEVMNDDWHVHICWR